jgi:hypothetical protein
VHRQLGHHEAEGGLGTVADESATATSICKTPARPLRSEARARLNALLARFGLHLETLTAHRKEQARLLQLRSAGHFERPAFPLPASFLSAPPTWVVDGLASYREGIEALMDPARNRVGYTPHNEYFSSPDAEVLYVLVRSLCPSRVVEVGSGFSTQVFRQAILDDAAATTLVSVDPSPRRSIEGLADRMVRMPIESSAAHCEFRNLSAGDVLFIDSGHTLRVGNDVAFLYGTVLPTLPSGVVVHIHDVFLPYEYPEEWIIANGWQWNEQCLVQCLLASADSFEVLWPGHYLQRTRPDFASWFPHSHTGRAQSLWLRKR